MEPIEAGFRVLEVLILAFGAFFAVRQLRLQREEIHLNALRENRRHSMEIDARLATFGAARDKVEATFPPSEWTGPIALERLQAAFSEDETLCPALLRLIEQLELLALPVCAEAADEDIAFELVGSTTVAYATAFRSFIEQRRREYNHPDFYIYLTTLVDTRWAARDKRERMLLSQGSPPYFLREESGGQIYTTPNQRLQRTADAAR